MVNATIDVRTEVTIPQDFDAVVPLEQYNCSCATISNKSTIPLNICSQIKINMHVES